MAMQWFRLYAEFATDPKVQTMSETFQRRFVMLLCMQCAGQLETSMKRDETQVKRDIAFQLRISEADVTETLAEFERRELTAGFRILAWNKRQFKSDVSTERVRKFRKRKGNVSSNVSETPSETESDTETEQNPSLRSGLRATVWKRIRETYPRGIYREADWLLAEREFERLVEADEDPDAIANLVTAYRAQQEAKQALGSQFVLSPAKFFADKRWRGPFPLPATKADTRLAANVSAAEEFMRRTEVAQ